MVHGDHFNIRTLNLGWSWAPFKIFGVETIGDGSCFVHSILYSINRLNYLPSGPLTSSINDPEFLNASYRLIGTFPSRLNHSRTDFALAFRQAATRWLISPSGRSGDEVITTIRDHPDTIRIWFGSVFAEDVSRLRIRRIDAAALTEHLLTNWSQIQQNLASPAISDPISATTTYRTPLTLEAQLELYMKLRENAIKLLKARDYVIASGQSFSSQMLPLALIPEPFHEVAKLAEEDEKNVFHVICRFLNTYSRLDTATYMMNCLRPGNYRTALEKYVLETGNVVDLLMNRIMYGEGDIYHARYAKSLLESYTRREQFEELARRSLFVSNGEKVGDRAKLIFDADPRLHKTEDDIPIAARVTVEMGEPILHKDIDPLIANADPQINYFAYEDGELLRRAQSGDLSLPYILKILPTHQWIGDDYITLLSSLLRVNIYILQKGRYGNYMWMYNAFTHPDATHDIAVQYLQGHYEAMGVQTDMGPLYIYPLGSPFSEALHEWSTHAIVNGKALSEEEWYSLRYDQLRNDDRLANSNRLSEGNSPSSGSSSGPTTASESSSQRLLRSSPEDDVLPDDDTRTPSTQYLSRPFYGRSRLPSPPTDLPSRLSSESGSTGRIQGFMAPRYRQSTV